MEDLASAPPEGAVTVKFALAQTFNTDPCTIHSKYAEAPDGAQLSDASAEEAEGYIREYHTKMMEEV